MKSTDDRFDEEVKRRLGQYEEEPREDLWSAIAPKIAAPKRPSGLLDRPRATRFILLGMILFMPHYFASDQSLQTSLLNLEKQKASHDQNGIQSNKNTSASDIPSSLNERGKTDKFYITTLRLSSNTVSLGTKNTVTDSVRNELNMMTLQGSAPVAITSGEVPAGKPDTIKRQESLENVSHDGDDTHARRTQNLKHNKFSIYFTVMPTFGYQRIESNTSDNIIIQSIKRVPAFSLKRLGVRAELGAEYPISRKLKAFGSLLYYQRKQTIEYLEKQLDGTNSKPGPDGTVILEPSFSYEGRSFEYELKNIGMQVGVNWEISKRRLLHTAGTGLEFHLAMNKQRATNEMAGYANDPSAFVFYNLYYRLQYPSEGRLKAVFQPTLNYSFYINDNLNAPFYVKPYGLGLHVGCTYAF